jgi:transcription elongation factor Elf1
MGMYSDVICNVCGWRFAINVGGGFEFYDLHCEVCGRHKRVEIEEIKDARLAFAKTPGVVPPVLEGRVDRFVSGRALDGRRVR